MPAKASDPTPEARARRALQGVAFAYEPGSLSPEQTVRRVAREIRDATRTTRRTPL